MTEDELGDTIEELRADLLAQGLPDFVIGWVLGRAWDVIAKLAGQSQSAEEWTAAAMAALAANLEDELADCLERMRVVLQDEVAAKGWPDSVVDYGMERAQEMLTEKVQETLRTWLKLLSCQGSDGDAVH